MKAKQQLKTILDCLHYSISKDETRKYLQGVIHYSALRALISADGFKMTVLKGFYVEELADKIIDPKTFQIIKRDYPNVMPIIPDLKKFESALCLMEKHFYIKKQFLHFELDDDMLKIKLEKSEKTLFTLRSDDLKPILNGGSFRLYFMRSNALAPITISLDDDCYNFYLVMPIKQ